ncbi:hypothetical protein [Roseomonas fluvialis]|uniref:Lipoprotein n=1 Tax=Roseomonas fluvialis TaxID=1750527 RepID=A0ABN6P4G2_9PROT|nr:hypothetical protein [Roseomonas fluvialis]BDG73215.1 hypothetical protein Rmf_31440 [Roseomonas fluvialis]
MAVLLLAGCAAEEPPPDDLPLPPEPPTRIQSGRQPATPARPRGSDAEAPPAAPAEATAPEPAPAPLAPAPAPAWRVARDGTLGCADPAPLRLLRQGADTPPRLLAEARASGGCRTTFRVNAWAQEASEGDMVRLRLLNGDALTLWFLRVDLVAP